MKMGRWGVRKFLLPLSYHGRHTELVYDVGLFEGDRDLDIIGDIEYLFKEEKKTEINFSGLLNDLGEDKDKLVAEVRAQLDANGVGDELFKICRAKEGEYEGQYNVIILGALMMLAGARICQDDLQHLRELVLKIHCSHTYALPIFDSGFRGPGRAQVSPRSPLIPLLSCLEGFLSLAIPFHWIQTV